MNDPDLKDLSHEELVERIESLTKRLTRATNKADGLATANEQWRERTQNAVAEARLWNDRIGSLRRVIETYRGAALLEASAEDAAGLDEQDTPADVLFCDALLLVLDKTFEEDANALVANPMQALLQP